MPGIATRPPGRPLPVAGAAEPPPFVIPGEHFAAALAWLGVGALGLILVAPRLAVGAFIEPRVFAVTHVLTLGVIATAIFGALHQLFPVTMGVGMRSIRWAHAGFWTLQLGTAVIVAGFWWWSGVLQATGWLVVSAAVFVVSMNLLRERRKAVQGRLIGWHIVAAHSALGLAMTLAAARIGETLGWWTFDRLGALAAHYHLAVFGFATFTAAGVGSRMLPMFALAHGYTEWPLAWALGLGSVGQVAFAVGATFHLPWLSQPGALVLAAAGVLYLYQVTGYFRARARRRLDPGLAHVVAAFAFLSLALLLGMKLALAPRPSPPRLWGAYGLLGIAGWLVLLVIGVWYKILPFLTWLHRFATKAGTPGAPTVADLTRPAWAWTSLVLLTTGVAALVVGVAAGAAPLARSGAALFAAGVAFVIAQHLRLYLAHR